MAVHRSKVAVFICPFVPNAYLVFVQVLQISVAAQKPQQLIYNRLQMQLLRRKQREAFVEVEAHLVAEYADCPGSCTVTLFYSFGQYAVKQVKILFHFYSDVLLSFFIAVIAGYEQAAYSPKGHECPYSHSETEVHEIKKH